MHGRAPTFRTPGRHLYLVVSLFFFVAHALTGSCSHNSAKQPCSLPSKIVHDGQLRGEILHGAQPQPAAYVHIIVGIRILRAVFGGKDYLNYHVRSGRNRSLELDVKYRPPL